MENINSEQILHEIVENIKKTLGIRVYNADMNIYGYANLKWKIETDSGLLFIKQYNKVRYSDELLKSVEKALNLQQMLYEYGIPCPTLYKFEDTMIQRTPSGERYILTEYCDGEMVEPGKVNIKQMNHLGRTIGNMHRLLYEKAPQSLPLHWQPDSKEITISKWEKNWQDASSNGSTKYMVALEKQRKIIDEIDLTMFSDCEEGWVHWDLFVDNLLFFDSEVAAILDFDRLHYIYPEFDISRPILSGTIFSNSMDMGKVRAFIEGYKENMPLSVSKLVRSIRLTWWKEASWVNIHSEKFRTLSRFVDESIWVGDHWNDLEEMFSTII